MNDNRPPKRPTAPREQETSERRMPQGRPTQPISPTQDKVLSPERKSPAQSRQHDSLPTEKSTPRQSPPSDRATPSTVSRRPSPSSAYRPPSSDLKNNLRSQTPLNRKLRQQTAPTEPGTVRRTTKPQYFRVKKQDKKERRKNRSLFRRRLVLTLVIYALLLLISFLLVSLWLPRHTTPETKDFVYQIGKDDNIILKKVYSWSTVRTGDIYYLDMTGLASYCDMTTTGDSIRMRYIVKATGETVEFTLGQSVAYINGVPERTGGDVYEKDGKIYVPLDFVRRCFTGLSVTLDTEANKITIVRNTDENNRAVTISFVYQMPSESPPIVFNELDLAIQNQILFQNPPQSPPDSQEPPADENTTAP